MDATFKKLAASTVAAILVLALAALPAQAMGSQGANLQVESSWILAGTRDFAVWLLDRLGLADGPTPDSGLTRVTAAGGGGMDPDGTPSAAGGGTINPDGTSTPGTTGGTTSR